MNIEETLAETLASHPSLSRDQFELIQTDIDGWEETTHFEMLYGSKMIDDAKEETEEEGGEAWIDAYQDNKSAFWEGYLAGRKAIGKDICAIARKLIDKKKPRAKKPSTKRRSSKRSSAPTSIRGLR